jgi:hypothetical protein
MTPLQFMVYFWSKTLHSILIREKIFSRGFSPVACYEQHLDAIDVMIHSAGLPESSVSFNSMTY